MSGTEEVSVYNLD